MPSEMKGKEQVKLEGQIEGDKTRSSENEREVMPTCKEGSKERTREIENESDKNATFRI